MLLSILDLRKFILSGKINLEDKYIHCEEQILWRHCRIIMVQLKEEVAQGTYANLAIITHSSSEFIVDFVRVMPGLPKAGVQSRIVLTPEHAKRLMYALQENVAKYERNFGPIRMPEEMNGGNNGPDGKTFIPPISGFKGEA